VKHLQQSSDEDLMSGVKNGQLHMLGELFERHHKKIFNFCLKFCGDRQWSEDMVQDTFCRMLKYSASYSEQGNFLPWVYNIARNVALDYIGAENKLARDAQPDPDSFTSAHPDPERLEDMKQRERKLHDALLRLAPDKRQLVILSRIRQIRISDLAVMYGCNQGAIKVRIHRVLEELRAYYNQCLDAENPTGKVESL